MGKILWISAFVPYNGVAHAGGQIENFYIKQLAKNNNFDVHLLSFGSKDENDKIDLEEYGITYNVKNNPEGKQIKFWNLIRKINMINPIIRSSGIDNPFIKFELGKMLKCKKNERFHPDVIILQWTQIIIFIDLIKKYYPNTPIICIEEDVTFLAFLRRYENENRKWARVIRNVLFKRIKRKEFACLSKSILTILNNHKDEDLLKKDNDKINTWVWAPYFHSLLDLEHNGKTKDILFYGAMSRKENWSSAIWFIENVFNKIKDYDCRFVIVGNKPNDNLLKYKSDRIIITGFVDSVEPFFQNCMCLVAPLQLGAGIKIKILEGLSAGIPVLTNDVGIEGIPAIDKKHYYHCNDANDYLRYIDMMLNGNDTKSMSMNQKEFMRVNFDYNKSCDEFINILNSV